MNNIEILTKLADRTISYFQEDLLLSINTSYKIEEVSEIKYFDISSLISLSSDMIGTVSMSVSNKLAFSMVENFIFGEMSKDELSELSSENVAETLNVTLGNILTELDVVKNGGKVNISTPYTMCNSVTISKKKNGKMYVCELTLNDEIIILSYMI